MKKFFLWGLFIFFGIFIFFEVGVRAQQLPEVTCDLDKKKILDNLPFDTPFLLKIVSLKVLTKIEISVKNPDDIQQGPGSKVAAWESEEGAAEIRIQIPPLKPLKRYQFSFMYEAKIPPEQLKEVRSIISSEIDSFLKENLEARDNLDELIKELLKKFPEIFPGNIDGIALKPKKGSVFDGGGNGDTFRNNIYNQKKQKIISLIQPLRTKNIIIMQFMNDSKEFLDELLKVKTKEVAENGNDTVLRKALSFKFIITDKELKTIRELVSQFTSYNEDMVSNIAGGLKQMQNASEHSEPPIMENFWEPSDCDNQIENYRKILPELTVLRVFLGRVKYGQESSLSKDEKKISPGIFSELDASLEKCQDFVNKLINDLGRLKSMFELKENQIGEILNTVSANLQDDILVDGATSADFETRAKWYISADLGFAWAPALQEVFPYMGVNFNFRPINKQTPLRLLGKYKGIDGNPLYKTTLWHRMSGMIGISTKSLGLEGQRENLFGNNSLLVGGGYRWTDSIRTSVGMVVFKALDADPSITDKKVKISLFFSASLDWDVRQTLGGLLQLITGE